MLLENPRRVKFNRINFTIFRPKVLFRVIFSVFLLLEIQTNYEKLGLEGKSIERVHTWANNTSYTKYMNIPPSKRGEIFSYLTTTTPSTWDGSYTYMF